VVLLDVDLPDGDRLDVASEMLKRQPDARVLAVCDDRSSARDCLDAGFSGVVTRDAPAAEVVRLVASAGSGELGMAQRATRGHSQRPSRGVDRLTPRERETLKLLVQGSNGKEIADRLSVREETVRTHVKSILAKLQVHSRLEAVTLAVRHGLVDVDGAAHVNGTPHRL
jgi:two-component system nitrate/nitrite response regulator NarL